MAELKFTPNEAGEAEGLSDAGIETYRDNPFPAVARETSQNSRDAHDTGRHGDEPVRIMIDMIEIDTEDLPAVSHYRKSIARCLAAARVRKADKEIDFFERAQAVLDEESLPILRISDTNTLGLRGPCAEGRPFHSLVKSTGVSDKPDETSGGSFGIGKSAVFAASDLQTVFYSTLWNEADGEECFLAQGKTKFRSFEDENGDAFRSVGYWGNPNGFMPVERQDRVPHWLRRSEVGTTVCSIAVRDSEDWREEYTSSLLINFFGAIFSGSIEFDIDGDVLNAHTLARRFSELEDEYDGVEEFEFARQLYECLADEHEGLKRTISIPDVGDFELKMVVRDGLPKRVGFLRNGMYITDGLGHFGDKFARFSMYRDFIAVVEPADESSSAWLRSMENPRHDEFSPKRLLDPAGRREALFSGKKLVAAIREILMAEAKTASEDETDLEELSEFFALDNDGRTDEDGERAIRTFRVQKGTRQQRRTKSKPPSAPGEGEAGGRARGEKPSNGTEGGGPGDGPGEGEGGTGNRSTRRPLVLFDVRSKLPDPDDPRLRRVFFTPERDGKARLRFASAGVSNSEVLATADDVIELVCYAGRRQEIDVRFQEAYSGPLEITSWEEVGNEAL